jgi:hypothetical protein
MMQEKELEEGKIMEDTAEVTQDIQAEEADAGSGKADALARKVDEINEQKNTKE